MLVKVFESEDMASALKKVKETLGPDALILSTRTIRKGGLGVLGKPILEVTAAVEPAGLGGKSAAGKASSAGAARGQAAALKRAPVRVEARDEISYEDIWASRQEEAQRSMRPVARPQGDPRELQVLRGEIDELKTMMRGFLSEVRAPAAPAPPVAAAASEARPAAAEAPSRRRTTKGKDDGEAGMATLIALLRERGIDDEAAETIVRFASQRASAAQRQNPDVMRVIFGDVIGDLIQVSRRQPPSSGQRRLALIGPTGVGKTTTIAKLAADHLLNGGKSAALITIDTFRIAAVEQLKVYGQIMNLPVEVVVSAKEMRGALNRHRDKDLILIDTAGRSPRDEVSLQELGGILAPELKTENHLVLSAATRDQDLYETVARFGRVPIHNLIFTKIDECASAGALLNVHLRHNFPIAYLTNGQRVPEDILVADSKKIAHMIMGQG